MPMPPPSGACCIGDVHGDIRVRGVGAQELIDALLGVPRVEAVLGGQPVEIVHSGGQPSEVGCTTALLPSAAADDLRRHRQPRPSLRMGHASGPAPAVE
eukprot:8814839-Pyramimonas_sp.AAC.1